MRYLVLVVGAAVVACVLEAVVDERRARRPVEDVSRVGTPTTPQHCGCVNWRSCTEPCQACCGPNGYADCFKNPDPSCCEKK